MQNKQLTKEEKIISILEKLPILADKNHRIPYIAKDIESYSALAKINELPRALNCSEKQSQKELKAFISKSLDLYCHIGTMHKTSLERFNIKDLIHPILLQHELKNLIYIAKLPAINLKPLKQKKSGRPAKLQAKHLTGFLAKIYTELTGKKAARNIKDEKIETGKYLEFVSDIFTVLEIKSSARSQVSVRSKNMYKKSLKKGD